MLTKTRALALLISFCIAATTYGQGELWSQKAAANSELSQLPNGAILVSSKKSMTLYDNVSGEERWSAETGSDGNFTFLENLPILYFEGKNFSVIDATNGYVIDESTAKTEVLNTTYLWDQGKVIMELSRNKMLHVLSIDLKDVAKSWNTKVGKVQKSMFGLVSNATKNAPSLSSSGELVLVDKKKINILDPMGKVKETVSFKKDIAKVGFNAAKNIIYVVEDKKKLAAYDASTGGLKGSYKLKEKEFEFALLEGSERILLSQKKTLKTLDAISLEESNSKDLEKEVNSFYTKEDGIVIVAYGKSLAEVNAEGDITKTKSYDHDIKEIFLVDGESYVNGDWKINKINLDDLSLEMKKSARLGKPFQVIEDGANKIYISKSPKSISIDAFNKDGKSLWDRSVTLSDMATFDMLNDDLLVLGGDKMDLVNTKTGKSVWKKSIKVDPSFDYVYDKNSNQLIAYSDKKLYRISMDTGKYTVTKEKFKFRDFDYNAQKPLILTSGDNVLLKGSNSIFISNARKEKSYEKHYRSISGKSGLMKLAAVATTVGAIATGNGHQVLSVYDGKTGEQLYKGGLVDGINDVYGSALKEDAKRRAKQNSTSAVYPFVHTKVKKNQTLIFLDANTGKERFDVSLKGKKPKYIVDEVDGILYYVNKGSVVALDLK